MKGLFGNFKLVEELLEGANNVLHHFHDLYNGQKPFALDWHSGNVDIPGLSRPQKEAVYLVTQKVRERGKSSCTYVEKGPDISNFSRVV